MSTPLYAQKQMAELFLNSPYLGGVNPYPGHGKYRFYYLGYRDIFGVRIPATNPRSHFDIQIWPRAWVEKHLSDLRERIKQGREGKLIKTRHNLRLIKRAKANGNECFRKPERANPQAAAAVAEKDKLPIRKKKTGKRVRRQLKL